MTVTSQNRSCMRYSPAAVFYPMPAKKPSGPCGAGVHNCPRARVTTAYRWRPRIGFASASTGGLLFPQLPGTTEDLVVGFGSVGCLFRVQELNLSLAEAQRLGLQLSVDLGVDGAEHDLLQRVADDDIPMAGHQCDRRCAEGAR